MWEEVRREITETELLLDNRLGGINIGNDNFNPLLAMDIIHKVPSLYRFNITSQQAGWD